MQKVIMSDKRLHELGVIPEPKTIGQHDPEDAKPHNHYSILTIKGEGDKAKITDMDYGYHTMKEARAVVKSLEQGSTDGKKADKPKAQKKAAKKGGSKRK